ncbi:MAG: hypothetical protein P9L94_00460 [Candidatus Hinthialibacter antarcticus]|nr:hypothetical protein [Candidatus Hinthialibacter antarcticus]
MKKNLYPFAAFFLIAMMSATAFAQDLSTSFSTGNGDVFIDEDTEWEAEDPFSDAPILNLSPKEGMAVAKATLVEGTRTTIYTAKKIRYALATEEFLLEGDAKIQRGDEYLSGPEKIQYDPKKLIMILVGTPKTPAQILYNPPNQDKVFAKSVEFTFRFTMNGKDKELTSIKTKGNQGSRMGESVQFPKDAVPRKASGS